MAWPVTVVTGTLYTNSELCFLSYKRAHDARTDRVQRAVEAA